MKPEPMIGEEEVRAILLPFVLHVPEAYEAARAAISAHLAALERAGWKCVPVKATEAMIEAADAVWEEHDRRRVAITGGGGDLAQPGWETQHYQAMLSAAPPPQNSDEVKP